MPFLTKLERTVSGANEINLKAEVVGRMTTFNCFLILETWFFLPPMLMTLLEIG